MNFLFLLMNNNFCSKLIKAIYSSLILCLFGLPLLANDMGNLLLFSENTDTIYVEIEISATDGTFKDQTILKWENEEQENFKNKDIQEYRFFRRKSEHHPWEKIGNSKNPIFYDMNGKKGVIYEYKADVLILQKDLKEKIKINNNKKTNTGYRGNLQALHPLIKNSTTAYLEWLHSFDEKRTTGRFSLQIFKGICQITENSDATMNIQHHLLEELILDTLISKTSYEFNTKQNSEKIVYYFRVGIELDNNTIQYTPIDIIDFAAYRKDSFKKKGGKVFSHSVPITKVMASRDVLSKPCFLTSYVERANYQLVASDRDYHLFINEVLSQQLSPAVTYGKHLDFADAYQSLTENTYPFVGKDNQTIETAAKYSTAILQDNNKHVSYTTCHNPNNEKITTILVNGLSDLMDSNYLINFTKYPYYDVIEQIEINSGLDKDKLVITKNELESQEGKYSLAAYHGQYIEVAINTINKTYVHIFRVE